MTLKKIETEKYNSLKQGTRITVEAAGLVTKNGSSSYQPICKETGKLLSVSNKVREVLKDGKPTGKKETFGNILVYVPDKEFLDDKILGKLKIHYSVIGCGLFQISVDIQE